MYVTKWIIRHGQELVTYDRRLKIWQSINVWQRDADQEIHENDRHQQQEDEENNADVDVERMQVVFQEDVVEFDLAERHHDDVQEYRFELENFLQRQQIDQCLF